jgi:hypothetical protein
MAIFLEIPIKTLSELQIKASELLKLTTVGRVYIGAEKRVPEHIWAEIDQTLDELIDLIPPDEVRRK